MTLTKHDKHMYHKNKNMLQESNNNGAVKCLIDQLIDVS